MLMKPKKNRFRVKIVVKFLKQIKQTKRLSIWKSEMKQADRKKKKEHCSEDSKSDPVEIVCCPKISESKNNFYTRNDRPYGLKRFILKTLYEKCSCGCCCCKCFCEKCCFHNPAMRLLFLLWIIILLTFGFYRTFGRFKILRHTYEYSLTVD